MFYPSFNKLPGGSTVQGDSPDSLSPFTSYVGAASNYLPSFTPTSSLSLTPPSSSSSASTANSGAQSSMTPTILLLPPVPTPGSPSPSEFDVGVVGAEYERLVALYDEMTVSGTTEEHHSKPVPQKTLRALRLQQEQLRVYKKVEEQRLWEAEAYMRLEDENLADIGANMLREWVTVGSPQVEVTESMRHRQRGEVALLASRFGVYHGWARNRYGLPGRQSEVIPAPAPDGRAAVKPRGWTGW